MEDVPADGMKRGGSCFGTTEPTVCWRDTYFSTGRDTASDRDDDSRLGFTASVAGQWTHGSLYGKGAAYGTERDGSSFGTVEANAC